MQHRGIFWTVCCKRLLGVGNHNAGKIYEYTFRFRTDHNPDTTNYVDKWFITNQDNVHKAAVECIDANW
jgi:hypothetical protein